MNRFENTLNKDELKKSVIKWVLKQDDYDGAIGGIYAHIPWSAEMQSTITWEYFEPKFSDCIPCCDDVANLLEIAIATNDFTSFNTRIDRIVNEVSEVYADAIETLNKEPEPNITPFKSEDFANLVYEKLCNTINVGTKYNFALDFQYGNEIFATNTLTDEHFTIKITKEK